MQVLAGDVEAPGEEESARLFLFAGDVGLVVAARAMTVINAQWPLPLAGVAEANGRWWEYWRDYWDRRGTPQALPEDYACEVTIPLKQD